MTPMDKERFLQSGLLEQYVLGLTSEEENEEVERYARAFPEIQSEIDILQIAVMQYAEEQIGASKAPEMPGVNGQSAGAWESKAKQPAKSQGRTTGFWVVTALLGLSVIFGFYYFSQAQNSQERITQLNNNLVAYQKDCEKEQQTLQSLQQQLAFYEHTGTWPLQLTGTPLSPDSRIRVYWNEQEKQAMLQIVSLPDAPADKQYQLWADKDGEMVDLGLIDSHNHQPQAIRCLPKASRLNITLEPVGGSKEPHVDQIFAATNLP